jgi:DNA-binding beta-propeller fold protein YncE
MLLSPDGAKLYVGTTSTQQGDVRSGAPSIVAVLDATTGAVLRRYPMPSSVVKLARNEKGTLVYATGSAADGTVVVMSLDLGSGATASAAVPGTTSFDLYTLGISADGARLFVPAKNGIVIFDAATLAAVGTVALPANQVVAPPLATPDGKTLLATGTSFVYMIDLATRTVAKKIAIDAPQAAFGDVLSPDGKTFYVNAGTLSAIDVASGSVKGSVALGQTNPFRLGISPDGTTLFATDLTFGTTIVVDAATLTAGRTLRSIAPPTAVVVRPNGDPLILNENSNAIAEVDAGALTAQPGFAVGDAPGPGVMAAGKIFLPEAANVAVEDTPAAPIPAKPITDHLIGTEQAAVVGDKVYVNEGSLIVVIDAGIERATGTIIAKTPSGGGSIGSALSIAGSGDGHTLLASYVAIQIDGGPSAGGIVKIDTVSGAQGRISSFPFVPGVVASNRTGTLCQAIGFENPAEIGVWDTVGNKFLESVVMPGNPSYVALASGADGTTLYLVDSQGKVDILDATTLQLLGSLPVGTHPSGIAISADGTQALVTDSASHAITVLDLTTSTIVGTVNVGAPSAGAVFVD